MSRRTLIAVIGLVGLLLGLSWWQARSEARRAPPVSALLFPDVDAARIDWIRVDNLRTSLQMRLERQADATWMIVDPLSYPAEGALVEWLLEELLTMRARPEPGADPALAGLAPPAAVIELPDPRPGSSAPLRVEVGEVDVDLRSVWVRTAGGVARLEGSLSTVLDRSLHDWRSRRVVSFVLEDVVEFARSGTVLPASAADPIDLSLAAQLDAYGWRATAPWRTRLDPGLVARHLNHLLGLRAMGFADELGRRPEAYGFDRPHVRLDLETANGERTAVLLVKESQTSHWLAMHAGRPYVWRLEASATIPLFVPSEEFQDRELARVPVGSLDSVHWSRGGESLRLERKGFGWWVSRSADGVAWGTVREAERSQVEDWLGGLDRTRFVEALPGKEFEPATPPMRIVFVSGESEWGIDVGAPHESERGGRGRLVLRDEDELVYLADDELVALLEIESDRLRSSVIVRLEETGLVSARIAGAGSERTWERNQRGRWSVRGVDQEARDFALQVDRLTTPRAARWLDTPFPSSLTDEVWVELVSSNGTLTRYRLGTLEGREVCELGELCAEVDGGLRRDLIQLLGP